MLHIKKFSDIDLKIDISEVLRYLGYKNSGADTQLISLIKNISDDIMTNSICKVCFEKFPVNFELNGKIDLGFMKLSSESLKKNLKNCTHIYVFAATIGLYTDKLIQKYSKVTPSKSLIAQATGTTLIEEWCNIFCSELNEEEIKNGNHLRPRFSPGYGDFPLESQKEIFSVLDCTRRAGISLTDSFLMIPSKSVSGIIGISKIKTDCESGGCESCKKLNCNFRRI